MTEHHLKIESHWYQLLWQGIKTHEVRRADRDYQKGDRILFKVGPSEVIVYDAWTVTHVMYQAPWVADGYVILSLEHPDAATNERQRAWYADQYGKQARSNAALRGQITKLRKRIGGSA